MRATSRLGAADGALVLAHVLVACGICGSAAAEDWHVGPEDYRERLQALKAGDTLWLDPGEYLLGLDIHQLRGEPARPITIAAGGAVRPLFRARPRRSTISIVDSSYVEIRALELDGGGSSVDGVKAEGKALAAHHITLDDLYIHDHDGTQQTVAISTKCPAWGWRVRQNWIERAGTGMYFGDADGSSPFAGGLIESNVIRDTRGYNIQIKHQLARPASEQMPSGPGHTIIRDNVFSKESGGARGAAARPNVLLGHFPASGVGSEDWYLVYRNQFLDNPTEALLQAEGNVAIYNNFFRNRWGDAVHVQPHKRLPRRIELFFNSVVAFGYGIRVVGGEAGFSQRVFRNLVYSDQGVLAATESENLVLPLAMADLADANPPEACPAAVEPAPEIAGEFVDAALDYYAAARTPGCIGAVASLADDPSRRARLPGARIVTPIRTP